ncbi:MAG: hypothetical protein ACLU4N_11255 [Butyricimonas faecihominis]
MSKKKKKKKKTALPVKQLATIRSGGTPHIGKARNAIGQQARRIDRGT